MLFFFSVLAVCAAWGSAAEVKSDWECEAGRGAEDLRVEECQRRCEVQAGCTAVLVTSAGCTTGKRREYAGEGEVVCRQARAVVLEAEETPVDDEEEVLRVTMAIMALLQDPSLPEDVRANLQAAMKGTVEQRAAALEAAKGSLSPEQMRVVDTAMGGEQAAQQGSPQEQESGSNFPVWAIAFPLVAVAGLAGAVLFYVSRNEKANHLSNAVDSYDRTADVEEPFVQSSESQEKHQVPQAPCSTSASTPVVDPYQPVTTTGPVYAPPPPPPFSSVFYNYPPEPPQSFSRYTPQTSSLIYI